MLPYTRAPKDSLQWIFATVKLKDSQVNYRGFTGDIISLLSALQCRKLEYVLLPVPNRA
jgi:hypothetical protein